MLHRVKTSMYSQWSEHFSTPWPDPELHVGTIGFFEGTGSFDYRQIPSHISIHAVLAGEGTVRIESGPAETAGPGDLFVFWPGRAVHYREDPARPWRYLWFHLRGERSTGLLASMRIAPPASVYPGGGRRLQALAPRWRAELDAGDYHAAADMSYAWEAAAAMLEDCGATPPARSPDVAVICRRYLDTYFMNPVGIDGLARYCGVDRTTLFRRFRAQYGKSPKQYLQTLRLGHARQLLGASDEPVRAIAAAAGFSSAAYFTRAFHETHGCSPSAWRERLER